MILEEKYPMALDSVSFSYATTTRMTKYNNILPSRSRRCGHS